MLFKQNNENFRSLQFSNIFNGFAFYMNRAITKIFTHTRMIINFATSKKSNRSIFSKLPRKKRKGQAGPLTYLIKI